MFLSGVGGAQNRAKKRMHIGLLFVRWTKTRLKVDAYVAPNVGCVNKQVVCHVKGVKR